MVKTVKKDERKLGIPINLQLFAEGAEDIDSGDNITDTEVADGEELENDNDLDTDKDLDSDEDGKGEEVVEPQTETKQSKEQDHAFADMRRRAEQAERTAQQFQQQATQMEEWVKRTFSQFGVKSWQDYQTKMENQIKQQREQQLKQAGVDPRLVEEIIKNDPELQTLKQQNQQLQQQMQETQKNAELVEEYHGLISEFGEQFPELQDPSKIPPEVWQKYEKGYSLVDAFYVTQKGKIMEQQTAKAKQSTLNNINSKQHLKTEGDGAKDGTDVVIPKEVMATFKDMGFSKKEAQQYYKKYYK